ncbi:hypothetical protein KAR91_85880 [Candidatus Pacearchaeota archaeon]|nr:hypothetical protein [Candidatus Pacearchaeota archaeon]
MKALAGFAGVALLMVLLAIAGLIDERNNVIKVLDIVEDNLITTQDSLFSMKARVITVEANLLKTIDSSLLWKRKFEAINGFLIVVDGALRESVQAGIEYRGYHHEAIEELDDTLKKYQLGIFGGRSEDTDLLINLKTRILIAEETEGITR